MSEKPPPPAPPVPLPEEVPDAPAEARWEIAAQWKRAWSRLKLALLGILVFIALVVAGQVIFLVQSLSMVHPVLGGLSVGVMLAAFGWLVGRPAWRFFRTPVIAQPPDVELSAEGLTRADVKARIDYDLTYLRGILNNPRLSGQRAAAGAARNELLAMAEDAKAIGPQEMAKRLVAFERGKILPLLKDLDREVDGYIRKEALAIGAATAVSLNGSADAFIVLWRNVNMIARIARLYYGRPDLRLSMTIVRDVAVAVILSRIIDDVSEVAGETIGGVANGLGGVVAGPIMDGAINALLTMKLGYQAKRRCRSFDVWSEARARQVSREVFEQVKKESGSLLTDLLKACGGFVGAAAGVTGKVMAAPRGAWSLVQNVLVRKKEEGGSAPHQ